MQGFEDFQKCLIVSTEFRLSYSQGAFAFPKGSPYTDLFNFHLNRMAESGELHRIINKYEEVKCSISFFSSSFCRPNKIVATQTENPLGSRTSQQLLLFLCLGLLLAGL